MKKNLTDLQKAFLEALFSERAKGDPVKAKTMAGYSPSTSTREVLESLKDEIVEATKLYIAGRSAKAAFKIDEIMDNPSVFGASVGLSAAKELLDRAGVLKPENNTTGEIVGVLLLPPKDKE